MKNDLAMDEMDDQDLDNDEEDTTSQDQFSGKERQFPEEFKADLVEIYRVIGRYSQKVVNERRSFVIDPEGTATDIASETLIEIVKMFWKDYDNDPGTVRWKEYQKQIYVIASRKLSGIINNGRKYIGRNCVYYNKGGCAYSGNILPELVKPGTKDEFIYFATNTCATIAPSRLKPACCYFRMSSTVSGNSTSPDGDMTSILDKEPDTRENDQEEKSDLEKILSPERFEKAVTGYWHDAGSLPEYRLAIRLTAIMELLRNGEVKDFNLTQLAARLGVTPRTLSNDIDEILEYALRKYPS